MRHIAALALIVLLLPVSGAAQTDPVVSAAKNQLSKIDDLKPPAYTEDSTNLDYKKAWLAGYLRYLEKRNNLIWEFVKAFPDHERAKPLMEEWYTNLGGGTTPAIYERLTKAVLEIDTILVNKPPEWVVVMGQYYRAYYNLCYAWNRLIALDSLGAPADDKERRNVIQFGMNAIEEFASKYPKEIRAVRLFDILAEASHDPISARAIYTRILTDYPTHPNKALYEGKMRRDDKVGEPFEMKFDDALDGSTVQTSDYKDKVLLVVFWAYSVPVCQEQMKEAKRLWFRYEHEGLEVVDISLDSISGSGKQSYNNFVKDHKMDWKHFFQGSGIESEYSRSWGINSLPTWFLVDRKGNLRYTDANRDTETKIKELLKEKVGG